MNVEERVAELTQAVIGARMARDVVLGMFIREAPDAAQKIATMELQRLLDLFQGHPLTDTAIAAAMTELAWIQERLSSSPAP